jgi:hypothetical protein
MLLFLLCLGNMACGAAEERIPAHPPDSPPVGSARKVGSIQDDRLTECSGMDASPVIEDLFWAVNDGGHGPFLHALGGDGRHRGRVRVAGALNRDWEGLATFVDGGRAMILIADVGDNRERYETYTLYVVAEPPLSGERYDESASATVARRIVFSYPDRSHDAEGVAVDPAGERVLILTKRDDPPLLFEVSLKPPASDFPVTARKVLALDSIPPPSGDDSDHPFGLFYSQPTGFDISPDGRRAVVLTYKDAYLFDLGDRRVPPLSGNPIPVRLPHPAGRADLRQREAICFAPDGKALFVTSEGENPGLYRVDLR